MKAELIAIENDIDQIKSAAREHSKASHMLSNSIKQAMKFSQKDSPNNPSYRQPKKSKQSFEWKKVTITKGWHTYRGYVSAYNVEILNSFNP